MPNAQGLVKKTVFAKQSAAGTAATTGGQIIRRTNSVFSKTRDKYSNEEIVSHQMSTGDTAGVIKTTGKVDGLLSPGTYGKLFASLVRQDFAAISPITGASITVAGAGPTHTITRAAGSFLTDGIKIGHVVRLTAGSFNAANLNKNLLVEGLTATVLTVRPLNGVPMVAEGPIASAAVSAPGKVASTPTSAHTNDYWTVEECYPDLSRFEQYVDCKIASADVTVPATGNATVSFDVPGLSQTKSVSATVVSPAAESGTNVLAAVNGLIEVGGVVTPITGAQFTITGNIAPGAPEVGSNAITDHVRGEVAVTGSFTAKFSSTTLQTIYDAQTVVTLVLAVTDGSMAAADFITFVFPAIKLFSDTPDDGEAKEIVRSYAFTAQYNAAGGAGTTSYQTIVATQDSQAA